MELPAGYRLRAPTPGDLGAVADVLAADEIENSGQVVLGVDFLRDEWSRPGFDLAVDARVALDGTGTVVGYVQAMREEPTVVETWGIVLPGHRGRGLGSSLLTLVERRADELLAGVAGGRFRHAANTGDHAAAAMLRGRGLRQIRHFWHMQIDLTGLVDPGPQPVAVEIIGIEVPGDLPAVHAVLEEAFVDDWGHHPEPFEQWVAENAAGPSFDPTLWRLATWDGKPVGALTAETWDDRGWVGYLGVLASCRGRGVGAALLRHAFAAFAARGIGRVYLNVDAENPTGATALYERVGMRAIRQWDLWERGPASG